MTRRSFLAVELGSTKVACVIGRPACRASEQVGKGGAGRPSAAGREALDGRAAIELLGYGLAEYPLSGTAWPCETALIARTLERALDETKVSPIPDRAVVCLSHPELSHAQVRAQIDLSDEPILIRAGDLQRLAAQAIGQSLGIDRAVLLLQALGYAGNGFERAQDPRGLMATRLSGTFQLVSMPLAVRRAAIQGVEAVGLEVERFLYSLQAERLACLDESLQLKRVLLIDLGGSCMDAGIVDQGVLSRTLSVPWGGATVTDAIAKACQVTRSQALADTLEGLASPKPPVRRIVQQQLDLLRPSLQHLLKDEPLPDAAVVTGRGALIDGMVEWIAKVTGIRSVLGRSPRTKRCGKLADGVSLGPAIGALEWACRADGVPPPRSRASGFVNRLVDRTKVLLTEYF